VNPDGTVTSVTHTVVKGSEQAGEAGKKPGEYVCVGLGYGAKAAITGVEAAAAVTRILPLALAGSLYAGVMLSPAVTPFVFAGITAVGVAAQLAGAEVFWGVVSDASGIPVGLPGLTGKDILGDLAQKGVERICELAIQEMTSIAEPWPSTTNLQKVLVIPDNKGGEPIPLLIDRRRQFLIEGAKKMPPMSQTALKDAKVQISCCDIRGTQSTYAKNQQVWGEYTAEKDRQLVTQQKADSQRAQETWARQQQNNGKVSGGIDRTFAQLKAEAEADLREAIGGGPGGGQVVISIGPGGTTVNGSPYGGTGAGGGSCGKCNCALNCLEYTPIKH